jgi:drug/metabolite transporter (DMT)-like permease
MKSSSHSMMYPILGIGANALWGTAFVIPYLLNDFSSEIITLSRYTVYGLISIFVFTLLKPGARSISPRDFLICNFISFCGNIGYYLFLTIGIKYSGFIYPTLIIGLLPVSVILLGLISSKEVRLTELLPSISIIGLGVVLLNFSNFDSQSNSHPGSDLLFGIGASVVSLILLTCYCVANARYLKLKPQISSLKWGSLLGICSLIHCILFASAVFLFSGRSVFVFKQLDASRIWLFILGVVFLGVFVSYLAMWLWNIASRNITSAAAGQILCFESIFALIYGYFIDFRLPNLMEVSGIFFVLFGAYLVQYYSNRRLRIIQ